MVFKRCPSCHGKLNEPIYMRSRTGPTEVFIHNVSGFLYCHRCDKYHIRGGDGKVKIITKINLTLPKK